MTYLFTRMCWLILLCTPLLLGAQNIDLPRVQSQYLYQAKNASAPILRLTYNEEKVQLHSPEGLVEFSQENITKLLVDVKRKEYPTQHLLAANVRLQAPANLPINYLNDLFFWLRIGGCNTLYVAVQSPSQTDKTPYLSIPIAPFPLNKKIYNKLSIAQEAHPKTSFIDAGFDWDWYFEQLKEQPVAYVPSRVQTVSLEGNLLLFQEQQVNPIVFSTMVQGALLKQYNSSYERARPKAYWSLLVQLEDKASCQDFATLMASILEGYHLYWEDLAFAKYQQTYLEIGPAKRWEVQQAAPLLPLYYDPLQAKKIASLYELSPLLWSELELE